MAATVGAWGKPGAWALDAEENETELLNQRNEDAAVNTAAETADFPSLSAAASTKTKKKKKQTMSLSEFTTGPKPFAVQAKSLTIDEQLALPTGPRERTAEELDRNRLGGGFRSYGGGRDEQPRRQGGGFNRESNREFAPSKADETDDWGKDKRSPVGGGFERRERGERGGFFTDSQSRADEVDNWASKKSFVPAEPRRYERRGGFGIESSNGGADADNWVKRKDDEGRKTGNAFDSLRERRGPSDLDSESWGRRRDDASGGGSGGGRPKLNLQPRTLPVVEVQPKVIDVQEKVVEVADVVVNKPRASNPFGEARPREEVLKEKGQDWKEIDEKLEFVKVKESSWADAAKRGFWGANGKDRLQVEGKTENAWRKPGPVDSRPESAGEAENGSAGVNTENGNGHVEEAEDRDTQIRFGQL
ncbi:hypothetical protein CASFOL_042046 [Castilleja foliolosa]|uniref:Eukaryotic translation initiation factor 4B3-like n=1 Tax=Castilleja foliolosa TaxID=1961234 RepID=A0ABD3B9N9_9LAMI